jgi:uncharacterized protein
MRFGGLFLGILLLASVDGYAAQKTNMLLYDIASKDVAAELIAAPFAASVDPDLPRDPAIYDQINARLTAALPGLKVAALRGNPLAQFNLGVLQYHGYVVPKDVVAALQAYDQAANAGIAEALVYQGDLKKNADGSQFDGAAAKSFYEAAAAKGSNAAKFRLYMLYANGNGIPADASKAKTYLADLVAAKLPYAFYYQALLYQNGSLNTPQDMIKAKELMQMAADQNYGPAQLWIGDFNLDQKSYSAAMSYFQKAWNQNYTDAAVSIGRMYREGQSVIANDAQAVAWYQRAADAGNGWGMGMLSRGYRRGDGVKQDYALAKSWAEKGTEAGNAIAELQLALIYQQGLGVPRNERLGFDIMVRVANKGQPDAICNLGIYYDQGTIVSRDRARSRQLRAQGANNGTATNPG